MMETLEPIRILIVDDSRIFRGMLQSILEQISDVRVIGSVFSGEKALEFIDNAAPDLVTLDVEMPGISGLDTLREIAKRNRHRAGLPPIDAILVSALTKKGSRETVEGLQLGALDFICKPNESDLEENVASLRKSIEEKIAVVRQRRRRIAVGSALSMPTTRTAANLHATPSVGRFRAIAIGTSTGGPEALGRILPDLAANCPVPIFIVQHILEGLSHYLAESLSRKCSRQVLESADGMMVQQNGIYLAKAGNHMLVRRREGAIELGATNSPPERGCRPSVDVFLTSAACIYGPSLLSIILTGMGDDGASGVRAVKRAGGAVIVQDEASCVVAGMPKAAIATGAVDEVLPLLQVPAWLAPWFR
ncbi:MAG: chemotaxis-specific protein-glutamate methyltransferase CheB [Pirellulaceae bacterium]|nr:chemotaxis-specific protein-glutamate methyltransferase CheB [Pirellulaceae bacterium]